MFNDNVQQRLSLFEVGTDKKVEYSNEVLHLTEKGAGQADVEVGLSNPCILFKDLEKRKLKYFKNDMCADYVLFEYKGQYWTIHIFELKRTVKTKEWEHIKRQFSGALQNALALAGVLDFNVDLKQVHLYTAYRNDLINNEADPVAIRCEMHEKKHDEERPRDDDWNNEFISLDFLGELKLSHRKVKLQVDNGMAKILLGKGADELSRERGK